MDLSVNQLVYTSFSYVGFGLLTNEQVPLEIEQIFLNGFAEVPTLNVLIGWGWTPGDDETPLNESNRRLLGARGGRGVSNFWGR